MKSEGAWDNLQHRFICIHKQLRDLQRHQFSCRHKQHAHQKNCYKGILPYLSYALCLHGSEIGRYKRLYCLTHSAEQRLQQRHDRCNHTVNRKLFCTSISQNSVVHDSANNNCPQIQRSGADPNAENTAEPLQIVARFYNPQPAVLSEEIASHNDRLYTCPYDRGQCSAGHSHTHREDKEPVPKNIYASSRYDRCHGKLRRSVISDKRRNEDCKDKYGEEPDDQLPVLKGF